MEPTHPPQYGQYPNGRRVQPGSDATGHLPDRANHTPQRGMTGTGGCIHLGLPPFSNMRICGYATSAEGARAGQCPGTHVHVVGGGIFPLYLGLLAPGTLATLRLHQHPIHQFEEGIKEEEGWEGEGNLMSYAGVTAWDGSRQYELSPHFGLRQAVVAC